MKTRPPRAAQQTGLPPPPAPPARDANPWTMSGTAGAAPQSSRPAAPRGNQRTARGAGGGRSPVPGRDGRRRWVPVMILLFIAGTGVQLAIQALESGDVEAAVGALVILAMAALIAWRRLNRTS